MPVYPVCKGCIFFGPMVLSNVLIGGLWCFCSVMGMSSKSGRNHPPKIVLTAHTPADFAIRLVLAAIHGTIHLE